MGKKHTKLSDQLRAAIEAADMSRYRIALEAKIDHATLSRFMHGKGSLSFDGLDRLGKVLGLRFTAERTKGD